jgi:hypothetical protein
MLHFWEWPLIEYPYCCLRVARYNHTVHIPCMGKGGNFKCKQGYQ